MNLKFWREKPKGTRPLRRHKRRWDYDVRMCLEHIGFVSVDWNVDQLRVCAKKVTNF